MCDLEVTLLMIAFLELTPDTAVQFAPLGDPTHLPRFQRTLPEVTSHIKKK